MQIFGILVSSGFIDFLDKRHPLNEEEKKEIENLLEKEYVVGIIVNAG